MYCSLRGITILLLGRIEFGVLQFTRYTRYPSLRLNSSMHSESFSSPPRSPAPPDYASLSRSAYVSRKTHNSLEALRQRVRSSFFENLSTARADSVAARRLASFRSSNSASEAEKPFDDAADSSSLYSLQPGLKQASISLFFSLPHYTRYF